jgi:hypothetical protein
MAENKLDKDMRLEKAIELHQDWLVKSGETIRAMKKMALAVHEAHAAGFTHKDLADMLGVSVKRIESYLRVGQV